MAVFGDLMKHTNDPLRAVCCASCIDATLKKFNQKRTENGQQIIWMGMGLNTGEVIAGNIGSEKHAELSIIGDAVNQAARMEKFAPPQQILIGETLYSKIHQFVEVSKPQEDSTG